MKFDSTGMVVTAHYTDGTKAVLPETGYTIFYGDKLTQGQEYVTIQYNDGSGNSDIKVRQTITVGAYEGPTPIPTPAARGTRTRRAIGISVPTAPARIRAPAQRNWPPTPSCGR